MVPYYSLFINGEFKKTQSSQTVINPADAGVIAEVAVASRKDMEYAVASSRRAFDDGDWLKLSLAKRREFLLKISQGILAQAGELAKLETLNTGKPIKESTFMDIPSSAQTFTCFADNFAGYLQEETFTLENAGSQLLRQPQGVVVLIVPWNYPLLIASWKLSTALAAGNTVILKPSSLTPLSALALAKIIQEAGLPEGVVNVVNGRGAEIGEMLCADKRIDMISFTGSNAVGKEILKYSSANVKKMILELGGKSASIIFKDADLEAAVNGSLCSIFLNQGQMCTAMSRIFIEEDIYEEFMQDFISKVKRIKLGPGLDYQTQMGPLISAEQRKKVMAAVEKAKSEGAKLLYGGKIPADTRLKKGFFFEPTVFSEVNPKMSIFQEEVFGPVVCVHKFSSLEEAQELANNTDFALAAAIWSKDTAKAQGLTEAVQAGIIWINTYGMFYPQVPYGGFKQSGFGKELGKEGFLEYTRQKNIVIDKSSGGKPLVSYWYGF